MFWLFLTACLGDAPDSSKTGMFEDLWSEFDAHYGGFAVKDVDWDASYTTYRPQVTDDMSDDALFDVISEMLAELDDGHVWLYMPSGDRFSLSRQMGDRTDNDGFDLALIRDEILEGGATDEDALTWGTLGGDVAYVHLQHMDFSRAPQRLGEVLDGFADAEALVLDVRNNNGGLDRVSAALAGCFAQESAPFMRVRLRNGPDRLTGFDEPIDYSIEPDARCAWHKPVVLVTDLHTWSAGETFTMAMRTIDTVTQIGEPTNGSFSDAIAREATNGWIYSVSVGDWRDHNDVSHEGIGMLPSVEVLNTVEDVDSGRDVALETALDLLEG